MGIACDMNDLQRDYSSVAAFQPAGMLDLHLLAAACGVYRPPPAAVLNDERAKQAQGITTFNRREQWGLAGAHTHMCWPCAGLQCLLQGLHGLGQCSAEAFLLCHMSLDVGAGLRGTCVFGRALVNLPAVVSHTSDHMHRC